MAVCVGPPDSIIIGAFTVLIGGQPAARIGDMTAHGGVIILGCPTVLIGDSGAGAAASVTGAPGAGAGAGAADADDSGGTGVGDSDSSSAVAGPDVLAPGGGKSHRRAHRKWTVKSVTEAVKSCDGGSSAKARTANGGKDPTVVIGKSSEIESGGSTDSSTGTITLDPGQSPGDAIETLNFEQLNLSRKADFDKVATDANNGDLSRHEYIKAIERIEYENVKESLKTYATCKKKWGMKASGFEWARKYKSFDGYYKELSRHHKEQYGRFWDKNYKSGYRKKHPPAKSH